MVSTSNRKRGNSDVIANSSTLFSALSGRLRRQSGDDAFDEENKSEDEIKRLPASDTESCQSESEDGV